MRIPQQIIVVIVFGSFQIIYGQDLTGRWVGSLDQNAVNTIEEYQINLQKANYTHDLTLTLFQDTSHVKGVYHVTAQGDTYRYRKFVINGSHVNGEFAYETTYWVEKGAYESELTYCHNEAKLTYSKKEGEEFLVGKWTGWDENGYCEGAYIFLKKEANLAPALADIDLSGEWRGYEDQSKTAQLLDRYDTFWEEGWWLEGEKTGVVKVHLEQSGSKAQGEYWDYFPKDSSFYADYKIVGWVEDSIYTFMSFEILEENSPEHIVFCEFWVGLKFTSKDGYDVLQGTAQEDYDGYPCAPAVIFLSRKTPHKKVEVKLADETVPAPLVIDTVNSAAGTKFTLDKVQFDQSSYKIRNDAMAQLDFLVGWMNDNPKMIIQLEGHTDNRGSIKLNMKLSSDRVNSIKEYLVKLGISKKRIKIIAYGSAHPIASNKNEETRKLNRRVELLIVDK